MPLSWVSLIPACFIHKKIDINNLLIQEPPPSLIEDGFSVKTVIVLRAWSTMHASVVVHTSEMSDRDLAV